MKTNYQVDRRDGEGKLEGYDMVKAPNIETALKDYLGNDYTDYTLNKQRINGKVVVTATCPTETSGYIEISRR